MFYTLPNDILYRICYNNSNNIKKEQILIEEKINLSNLLLVNKTLFNFVLIKYDKLVLCNFQSNYKTMKDKYSKFYEVSIYEDLSIINANKFKNVKKISLHSCYNITNVSALQNIQFVDLSNCFELEDVSMLGNCKKLELCNCYKIKNVSNLGNVSYLDLSYCDKIQDISNLGNQTYLNLKGTNICNVSNLSNVEVLNLSYNYNIYDISSLKNVKNLDISFCSNIELNTNMNNHTFVAEYTNLVDEDVIYLKDVINLIIRKNNYISDLSPLVKTKYLDIRQCKNIRVLSINTKLDSIDVSRDNYYYNLIQLGIHDLDIKHISIDNYY